MSSVVLNGDTSGAITIAAPAIAGANTFTLPALTGTGALTSQLGMRNRIINGAMVIDQRNAGASVTPAAAVYTLDRYGTNQTTASKFSIQQNAGSVTPPIGFTNYLGMTSLSAYAVNSTDAFGIYQIIEAFNTADLNWGTANAKTVTLSFWVYSSLTGTFGGALRNSALDRSCPFTYTISSANTWEQKSVTIAGDTTGTWLGATNGVGIRLNFSIGAGSTVVNTANAWTTGNFVAPTGQTSVVGTSGAKFYITGVQLEVGSSATGFEYRQYQQELALCQRYYYQNISTTSVRFQIDVMTSNAGNPLSYVPFPVPMRATPTLANIGTWTTSNLTATPSFAGNSYGASIQFDGTNASIVRGYAYPNNNSGWSATAEL